MALVAVIGSPCARHPPASHRPRARESNAAPTIRRDVARSRWGDRPEDHPRVAQDRRSARLEVIVSKERMQSGSSSSILISMSAQWHHCSQGRISASPATLTGIADRIRTRPEWTTSFRVFRCRRSVPTMMSFDTHYR